MAEITKISDKATKISYSGNVLYYFAFGTIVLADTVMQIKFINGVEQRFNFSDFTTVESNFEDFIDSLIALDYFRVPTTGSGGGGGGGGDATAANQSTQITEAQSTNTKLDTLIANNATEAKQDDNITALNNLLTELELKADLTETQPVSIANSIPIPTGASTALNQYTSETVLDKVLKELKIQTKLLRKILS